MTRAPVRTASCTEKMPTPPPAPAMTTASLAVGATARTVAKPVTPETKSAPATSQGTPAGFGVKLTDSTRTYSAWLARLSVKPITSSPTATLVTPDPTSSTTPARSEPWPLGKVAGKISRTLPVRIAPSLGLMDAARTDTSTWSASGSGRATSRTSRTSTSPYSSNWTAFIGESPLHYHDHRRLPKDFSIGRRPSWAVAGEAASICSVRGNRKRHNVLVASSPLDGERDPRDAPAVGSPSELVVMAAADGPHRTTRMIGEYVSTLHVGRASCTIAVEVD